MGRVVKVAVLTLLVAGSGVLSSALSDDPGDLVAEQLCRTFTARTVVDWEHRQDLRYCRTSDGDEFCVYPLRDWFQRVECDWP